MYRVRPDVNAIVHTHQPYASALAFLRREIPALTDEQVRFLGKRVAIIDYAPAGTGFLAKNVEKKVAGGDNAFIIANHGVVALGTDPDRAVFNMALLEKVSIAYLLSLLTETGKVYTIPDWVREIAFTKLRKDEKRIAAQITEAVPPVRFPVDEELPSADAAAARVVRPGPTCSPRPRWSRSPGASRPSSATPSASTRTSSDVMRRLRALLAQPVRGLRHDALLDVLDVLRDQVHRQPRDHRPRQGAHPGRGAAQPGLQLPVPAGHLQGRGRAPHRPGRQHLHRLPAGRCAPRSSGATTRP